MSGRYRPLPPEITLLEKRDGIPRRLYLPAPADAILLQSLVQVLERAIAAGQPHPNAYYSQTHAPPFEGDVDGTFAYPWQLLWPEFQKRIWRFTESFNYIVVTDIANYFDSIPLSSLRNCLVTFNAFKENVMNFLFFLLDTFMWRPYYMPQSGVGLPQINFDAPRLLAHAYLFKIDEELDRSTNGNFVRWMDDINCGVASIDAARLLLRNLEIVSNSLGVRLNAAKTTILQAREALEYFWVGENRSLTVLTNSARTSIPNSDRRARIVAHARRKYRLFRSQERKGAWDKIYKRYFTLFSLLRDPALERDVPTLLANAPMLREHIRKYYALLGPSRRRFQHLEDFIHSGRCLDDASLFEIVRILIAWRGQTTGSRRNSIISLAQDISRLGTEPITGSGGFTVSGVSSAIWLLAKHGTPEELANYLQASSTIWTRSSWAARQAAAATPLLDEATQDRVRTQIIRSGLLEALRVISSLEQLRNITSLDQQLRCYLLHPPTPDHPYPLEKVIISRVLLRGRLSRHEKASLRTSLFELIDDPCYLAIIRRRGS